MAKRKTKRPSAEAAVLVSYRLQFYSVVAAFSAVILQGLFFIMTSGIRSFGGVNLWRVLPLLTTTIAFPAVIFLIAYLSSRHYPVPISRWFVAVVKSFIAIILFTMLQSVWQWITLTVYNPATYYRTTPPAWVTSNVSMYLSMIIVLASMLFVIYRQKHRA